MTVRFKGTYRSRVRVRLLWFWVVHPWKTQEFDKTFVVMPNGVSYGTGPVGFGLALVGPPLALEASIAFMGQKVLDRKLMLAGDKGDFHAEPIKGAIFKGTYEVSA